MYIKSEIKTNRKVEQSPKIGMDAARFKYIHHNDSEGFYGHIRGEVSHVGIDFVDIKQENQSIVTVPINRISKVNWLEQKRERFCSANKYHQCQCVELNRNINDHHRNSSRYENCHFCDQDHKKMKKNKNSQNHYCKDCFPKSSKCRNHGKNAKSTINTEEYQQHQRRCIRCEQKHGQFSDNGKGHTCNDRFTCFCDFAIPFCDNRFQLRLAGLNDGLHFDLIQNQGRQVILELA